jgi:tetratricopeptide (TPR) repeat protein
MYPPEFFREFHFKVIGRHADPESFAREYGVGVAVLDHASPETSILAVKLVRSPSWRLVHLDRAASVFVHDARDSFKEVDLDQRAAELLEQAESDWGPPAWLHPRRRLYPALNLGLFLRAAGRPDLALNEADMLWRGGPHAALATFTAAAAEEIADLPRAIPRLRWALEENGDDSAVRSWLARALYVRAIAALEDGRVPDARSDLGEILALSPDEPGALLALARIEASEGNVREAERLLCRAIALSKDGVARRVAEADPVLSSLLQACK